MVSATEMLVLLGLAKVRESYGRELVHAIESLPNGRRLTFGTLYPTLHRMEKRGLVQGRWGDESEVREGARRRYYTLTAEGLRAFHETKRAFDMIELPAMPAEG